MSKYEPLGAFLAEARNDRIQLSFKEIERLLGFRLPPSAYDHPAWWSNTGGSHVQARAWLGQGFRTEAVDLAGRQLVFVKGDEPAAAAPSHEAETEKWPPMKNGHHPAYGAMKGTIVIMPGVDLTEPADPEWVARLETGDWSIGGLDD